MSGMSDELIKEIVDEIVDELIAETSLTPAEISEMIGILRDEPIDKTILKWSLSMAHQDSGIMTPTDWEDFGSKFQESFQNGIEEAP
jgi:hypothetical protein